MQSMEPATSQSCVNGIFPKAQPDQLSPRNDAVLPPCKSTDLTVRRLRLLFPAYTAGSRKLDRGAGWHAATLTDQAARMVR
jgi:hypothetical protein